MKVKVSINARAMSYSCKTYVNEEGLKCQELTISHNSWRSSNLGKFISDTFVVISKDNDRYIKDINTNALYFFSPQIYTVFLNNWRFCPIFYKKNKGSSTLIF